jgi:four helix bundle protein
VKYARFEELPVWKAAIELAREVYAFTEQARLRPSLRDQLERAALSVSNNIAEGFERGTTNELLAFLYIARGSAGETRSILCLIESMDGAPDSKPAVRRLKALAEGISRQLYAWMESIKNSDMPGQRHLTEASRRQAERDRKAEAFMQEVDEAVRTAREEREKKR